MIIEGSPFWGALQRQLQCSMYKLSLIFL